MDKMDQVEQIREKTGVSYEEAKNALDAAGGDVLDAIIALEREGKIAGGKSASAKTTTEAPQDNPIVSSDMEKAYNAYENSTKKGCL